MSLPEEVERAALVGFAMYPAARHSRAGLIRNGSRMATCDLDQLTRWAKQFPGCNWRVVFGPSGLWGLDVDSPETHKNDGIRNLADLVKICGPLPPRPTCRTGGGGLAMFFKWDGEHIVGTSGVPCGGVDPRRGSQSQTIPPSIHHETGRPYVWLTPPWEVAPPVAPEWLLKRVQPPPEPEIKPDDVVHHSMARNRLMKAVEAVAHAKDGTRNQTLNRKAYYIGRVVAGGYLSRDDAAHALLGAALHARLDHKEAEDTIRSAFRAGARLPMESFK